jgi:predicted enzyme related to lactoylglutathione lyase
MPWQIVSKQPDAHAGFYSAVFGWKRPSMIDEARQRNAGCELALQFERDDAGP